MKFFIQFLICGILTSLLFPPFFLTPLGFAIFPYLIHLISNNEFKSLSLRNHFFAGFIYGLGFFYFYLIWIVEPFALDEYAKNYFFFSYLLVIYCSIFFGLIFLFLKFFNNDLLKFIMLPTLIVISEYICGHFSFGFPWFSFALLNSANSIGTSLIFYTGTYGLSYISIIVFSFPYIFIITNIKIKNILLLLYLFLFITIFILTLFRSKNIDESKYDELTLSLAQINFPMNQKLNSDNLESKYNYIFESIQKNKSDIIIFAENNYPFLMNENEINYLQEIINPKTNVIIGSTRKEENKYFNSLFLINKKNYKRFDKKILVPFGEFIPFRSLFAFMEFIAGETDYSKGNGTRKIFLNEKINFIPIICYEIIYFWKILNSDNIATNFLINLTNDSWFGKFSGPYQHFYFAKLRAAEFNKTLVRVSNSGISGVVDNYGSVVDYIELNKQRTKVIKIKIAHSNNNYLHLHKFIIFLIFFSLIIGFIFNKKND